MDSNDLGRQRMGRFLAVAGLLGAAAVFLLFVGLREPDARSPTFWVTTVVVSLQPLLLLGNSSLHARGREDFPSAFLSHAVVGSYALVTLGTVLAFHLAFFRLGATSRAYVTVLVAEAVGAIALYALSRAFISLRKVRHP
jgi:hypothetical protein